jgi:peptide/nickel transport system substrate-binding protein
MKRRRLLLPLLLAAVGLAVLGAAAPARVKEGGRLVIGISAFGVIDPALVPDPSTNAAAPNILIAIWGLEDATCSMLFRYPATKPPSVRFDLVPEVAAGPPDLSPDRKTYTFMIRKGFRFSTGAPVTAASYARAIRRLRSPAINSPAKRYLQDVVGVEAVGNRLTIRLARKVPDFPARTTMPYFCPVQADLPIVPEGVGAPLPGSGPYYVAEFIPDQRVVLKRNRFYRGQREHHVDELVFEVGDDSATTTRKVEAGNRDVDLAVPLATLRELGAKYDVNDTRFFSVRSANLFYVFMNTERPLFRDNPKLRQAVNFALDRTAMLGVFGPYFGSRTDSYLPPGLPGYLDVHPYPVKSPDLAKARALARGNTRSAKAVYYACDNIGIRCLDHALVVQASLKEIGIDVQIKQLPYAAYVAKLGTRGEPFDITDELLIVPWVDPYQYVNGLLDGRTLQPTENLNISYFNSPHYNRLIDHAASLSGQARYDVYGKLALDIERNAAPMAAYATRNNRFFVSSRVGCVSVAAHGLDLAGLCLK